ncbi:unnamed protein product, partial [Brassica oleracea var. botrytis]
ACTYQPDLICQENLYPVFAICVELTNMDLHKLVLVPLEYAMQMMSANCKSCSALSTSVKTQKMLLCERLLDVSTSLPHVTSLGLFRVHLSSNADYYACG